MESLSQSKGGHALGFCLLLLVGAALPQSYRGQIMTGRGHVGMVRPQGLLPYQQGAFKEPLCLRELALVSIHIREIAESLAHVRVACTQSLFSDRQRALEEPLCLFVFALC